MSDQRQVRTRILVVTCGGALAVALYSLVNPTAGHRPLPAYRFPETVPLAGWESIGTDPLCDRRKDTAHCADVVQSGQRYRYLSNGVALDAEIRYVAGTLGDVGLMLRHQTEIPKEAFRHGEVRCDNERGYCSVFAHDRRAYLSACINRRGGTTVTGAQFLANHRAHDYSPKRVLLWLAGRESLRDYRCLWVNLSTPAQAGELPQAYPRLEAAWADWERSWQSHFPGYSLTN